MHEETSKSGDFRGRFLKVFTPAKSLVVLHVLMSSLHITEHHRQITAVQKPKKFFSLKLDIWEYTATFCTVCVSAYPSFLVSKLLHIKISFDYLRFTVCGEYCYFFGTCFK